MSFKRTHLPWLYELAWRKYAATKWRDFGERALELPLEQFASEGLALVHEHDAHQEENLELFSMEPLRRRLLLEQRLNSTLKDFAEEPESRGQFEYELHWYRWSISLLVDILRTYVYRAEDGEDVRELYHRDSKCEFEDFDKNIALMDGLSDDELFQLVHKASGRSYLHSGDYGESS